MPLLFTMYTLMHEQNHMLYIVFHTDIEDTEFEKEIDQI